MRKWIFIMALGGLIAGVARAQEPPTDPSLEPTAQVRHGVRMRLVPAAPPKPNPTESEDPLADIMTEMSDIVAKLASLKTDTQVQDQQKNVVNQLDQLIQQMEQQASGNGNSAGSNPTKPMNDSRIAGGPGGIGDLHDPKAGTRNFGALPAKDRDSIQQSKTEGFPPGYESLLQSYYQRLAQEKVGDESPAARTPSPATRSGAP